MLPGRGVIAKINSKKIVAGNLELLTEEKILLNTDYATERCV